MATPDASVAGTMAIGGDLRSTGSASARCGSPAGDLGEPSDPDGRAVLRRAVELGVNLIDTADSTGRTSASA